MKKCRYFALMFLCVAIATSIFLIESVSMDMKHWNMIEDIKIKDIILIYEVHKDLNQTHTNGDKFDDEPTVRLGSGYTVKINFLANTVEYYKQGDRLIVNKYSGENHILHEVIKLEQEKSKILDRKLKSLWNLRRW